MRRFSQRNSLVTLNEINITPLLDLAFVLLVIFIITRPMLEQSMDLKLPDVGKLPTKDTIDPKDVWTVEVSTTGQMRLKGISMNPTSLENALIEGFKKNPRMIVKIRAAEISSWGNVANVMGICMRNHIKQVMPQTAPVK